MENLKAKLIELEERLFKAQTRASAGELDALIADAFIEIAGSGGGGVKSCFLLFAFSRYP